MISKRYVEWAPVVGARAGVMVALDDLPKFLKRHNPGFRSLYEFGEEDAGRIRSNNHSRGLNAFMVYSDILVIDLDNGDKDLHKLEKYIKEHDYKYEIWSSGGKGYHVYIFITPMYGKDVPYSQKCFVETLGVDADLSLYQHGRLFRLPRTIHKKTNKRKELLRSGGGKLLTIEMQKAPIKADLPALRFENEDTSEMVYALLRFIQMIESPKGPGERHMHIWGTATMFARAGLSMVAALELLQWVNEQWPEPKDPEDVEKAVMQAYQKTPY